MFDIAVGTFEIRSSLSQGMMLFGFVDEFMAAEWAKVEGERC